MIVLNDYSGVKVQERTRSSGRKQTTLALEIQADAIAINLDEKAIAKAGADALVAILRDQVARITFLAAPSTIERRKTEAKAYAAGRPWTKKQFSGGRMGATPPHQSDYLFNDSGRLAKGIAAHWSASAKAWVVNLPANRFAPEFVARAPQVVRRFIDMVPALRAPLAQPGVRQAMLATQRKLTAVVSGKYAGKIASARLKAVTAAAQALGNVLEALTS